MPPKPKPDAALTVADKFEKPLENALNTALSGARSGVNLSKLEAALKRKDVQGAMRAINLKVLENKLIDG